MLLERILVGVYLVACIGIGILASKKVMGSRDEYWVAGRRIGTVVNSMAIMAALASGGSIIGVMGLAYAQGIPATLALFGGAVVGFPLASILVARPLRNFGKFTITDFLGFRYPHALVRYLVPILIVAAFTIYIVAQLKAAGITAEALLGIPYNTALALATVVFIIYVSFGGMVAITWTDVIQGFLMLFVIAGTALVLVWQVGSPFEIMSQATAVAPELGQVAHRPVSGYLGYFIIWATAIPVIPHIVMRVFTARDAESARLSLNLAMIVYSVMILAAVLAIVPVGRDGLSGAPGCGPAIPPSDGDPVSTADPGDCRRGSARGRHVHHGCAAARLQLGHRARHPRRLFAGPGQRADAEPRAHRLDLGDRDRGSPLGVLAARTDHRVLHGGGRSAQRQPVRAHHRRALVEEGQPGRRSRSRRVGRGRLRPGAAGHHRHRSGAGDRRPRGQCRGHDPGGAARASGIQGDGRADRSAARVGCALAHPIGLTAPDGEDSLLAAVRDWRGATRRRP